MSSIVNLLATTLFIAMTFDTDPQLCIVFNSAILDLVAFCQLVNISTLIC